MSLCKLLKTQVGHGRSCLVKEQLVVNKFSRLTRQAKIPPMPKFGALHRCLCTPHICSACWAQRAFACVMASNKFHMGLLQLCVRNWSGSGVENLQVGRFPLHEQAPARAWSAWAGVGSHLSFHAKSKHTGCKKSMAVNPVTAERHAEVILRLKHWCSQAKRFIAA